MAKFKYRMQNILDIKRKLEEQEKINYSLANAKLETEKQELQKLILKRLGYERRAKELMTGALNFLEIRSCKTAIDTMKVLVRAQMLKVHAAEQELELARRKLKEVMIERKTHEKLREKAFDEFKQEIEHEESKEIDELVSYSFNKQD